jgi:hypothetical protein
LFHIYSSKGEHSLKKYLRAQNYKKMLVDAAVIGSYINVAEFEQLCERVPEGRFSFGAFLKSLEVFASITSHEGRGRELLVLVGSKLLPLLERECQQTLILRTLSELLEDEEVLGLLPGLEKELAPYFKHFAG